MTKFLNSVLRWCGAGCYRVGLGSFIMRMNGRRIRAVAYHSCEQGLESDSIRGLGINTRPDVFRQHLDFYKRNYQVVSAADLSVTNLLPPRPLVITFDDGYRSVYENCLEPLSDRGMPATVFIVSSSLDNVQFVWVNELVARFNREPANVRKVLDRHFPRSQWGTVSLMIRHLLNHATSDLIGAILNECRQESNVSSADLVREEIPYIASERFAEMAAAGFTFGNHTANHWNLTKLDASGQLDEIRDGKETLVILPGFINSIAFPFGLRNEDTYRAAAEVGHDTVFELGAGAHPFDLHSIGRAPADELSDAGLFAELEVVIPFKSFLRGLLKPLKRTPAALG